MWEKESLCPVTPMNANPAVGPALPAHLPWPPAQQGGGQRPWINLEISHQTHPQLESVVRYLRRVVYEAHEMYEIEPETRDQLLEKIQVQAQYRDGSASRPDVQVLFLEAPYMEPTYTMNVSDVVTVTRHGPTPDYDRKISLETFGIPERELKTVRPILNNLLNLTRAFAKRDTLVRKGWLLQ